MSWAMRHSSTPLGIRVNKFQVRHVSPPTLCTVSCPRCSTCAPAHDPLQINPWYAWFLSTPATGTARQVWQRQHNACGSNEAAWRMGRHSGRGVGAEQHGGWVSRGVVEHLTAARAGRWGGGGGLGLAGA